MAGVYRPDFVESTPRPTVNPYLGRALVDYRRKQRKQNLMCLAISAWRRGIGHVTAGGLA